MRFSPNFLVKYVQNLEENPSGREIELSSSSYRQLWLLIEQSARREFEPPSVMKNNSQKSKLSTHNFIHSDIGATNYIKGHEVISDSRQ